MHTLCSCRKISIHVPIPRRVIGKGEESFTSQSVFKGNCEAKQLKQEFPEGLGKGTKIFHLVLYKMVYPRRWT